MSPLERAARAARLADQDWVPADGVTWHEQIARAVLIAVRDSEVTEKMWSAAYVDDIELLPSAAFPAMIDAILNDGEGE